MPKSHHANEIQPLRDKLALVEHVQSVLLVDMQVEQNTTFDWYDQHGNAQHETSSFLLFFKIQLIVV
jgi:hypothetical protein